MSEKEKDLQNFDVEKAIVENEIELSGIEQAIDEDKKLLDQLDQELEQDHQALRETDDEQFKVLLKESIRFNREWAKEVEENLKIMEKMRQKFNEFTIRLVAIKKNKEKFINNN